MKIKICGLMRDDDIEAVNDFMPDYIGFVFAGEKRRLAAEQARELKNRLSSGIIAVGVFVNASIDYIEGLCADKIIDVVQLHGDEDTGYIEKLKRVVDNQIIKAVRVKNYKQILSAVKLPVDYLLFDTYEEDMYGGSGRTFDYSVLQEAFVQMEKPCTKYFLAGGIDINNIEAIKKYAAGLRYQPYCLDVSTGVETDGKKERIKIGQMIDKSRL